MTTIFQAELRNRLLCALPPASFARLQPYLEPVDLPLRAVLVAAYEPTSHVHFIESGLGSIVTSNKDDEHAEVGHVGSEGMSAVHLLHHVDRTPTHTFMQIKGSAVRVPASVLLDAVDEDGDMRRLLLRFAHVYEIQLAHTALSNARYKVAERLARWLLMCHDRMEGDELQITHEFLALMLGVRRSGVTNEIQGLERRGAIMADRGRIRFVDRRCLERIAGESYGAPEAEYERLIGNSRRSRDAQDGEPAPA